MKSFLIKPSIVFLSICIVIFIYGCPQVVTTHDVYVAGYESNGTSINLFDPKKIAIAYDIFVLDNTVYSAGADSDDGISFTAKYWVNTTMYILTDGNQNSEAKSIVVVQK